MRLKICRKIVGKSGNANAPEFTQRHFREVPSGPFLAKNIFSDLRIELCKALIINNKLRNALKGV